MARATKRKFSSSTGGAPITVTATVTPGTTIHQAVPQSTDGTYDEVWCWVYNSDAAVVRVQIEFGTTTLPITLDVASKSGLRLVVPGLPLQAGKTVGAIASTVGVVTISGFVNRITD